MVVLRAYQGGKDERVLCNGMILFTLSISSRGFAFGFSKRPHTNRDTYKPMINPLISGFGTPLPTILNNPPLK